MSDSEIITIGLCGELVGVDSERGEDLSLVTKASSTFGLETQECSKTLPAEITTRDIQATSAHSSVVNKGSGKKFL